MISQNWHVLEILYNPIEIWSTLYICLLGDIMIFYIHSSFYTSAMQWPSPDTYYTEQETFISSG